MLQKTLGPSMIRGPLLEEGSDTLISTLTDVHISCVYTWKSFSQSILQVHGHEFPKGQPEVSNYL